MITLIRHYVVNFQRGATMGVDYYYANADKRQYYPTGLLGWNGRFSAIGKGPGARALAILLSDRGSWMHDRISVVADTSDECQELFANSIDIQVEVELMLIDVDGLEWIEDQIDQCIVSFTTMCAFAILLERVDIESMLDKKIGAGEWRRRYREHIQGNADYWSRQIFEAKKRGLKILN